jgi:hypothetical protein
MNSIPSIASFPDGIETEKMESFIKPLTYSLLDCMVYVLSLLFSIYCDKIGPNPFLPSLIPLETTNRESYIILPHKVLLLAFK